MAWLFALLVISLNIWLVASTLIDLAVDYLAAAVILWIITIAIWTILIILIFDFMNLRSPSLFFQSIADAAKVNFAKKNLVFV